jgi:fructokinase
MKKVTSIGEILFDVYPEEKKLGGAPFNFIYHIIKLTGSGNFVSRIGTDEMGEKILDFLNRENISSKYIQTDPEHLTGAASPQLDDNKVPEWIIEKNRAYDFIELNSDIEKLIKTETDCLYFGTLAQRNENSRNTIQSLFNKKIKYFCDLNIRQDFYSKEIIEKSLSAVDVLKLNTDELKLINDLLFQMDFSEKKIAFKIISVFQIELLCITKGSEGAGLYSASEENHFSYDVKNIVDTVGAGDAYAAILCLGYLNNMKLAEINKLASMFAGEIIQIQGAIPSDEKLYNKFKSKIFL